MNEAALRDESRLRDVERWKDKIEVHLDNRQVFFLFFGSAVVACLLFVLGVIVGKRIESRGRAEALDVQDPLAALDRAHQPPFVAGPASPPSELLFPKALQAGPGKGGSARAEKAAALVPTPVVPPPVRVAVPAAQKPLAVAPKPVVVAPPKPLAVAPKPVVAAAKPPVAVADPAKVKGKYTLQLSAFPTREEADAFAARFDGSFVIPTELPGKGTWFRVRCGNFATYGEATAAKTAFEKANKVIALVSTR